MFPAQMDAGLTSFYKFCSKRGIRLYLRPHFRICFLDFFIPYMDRINVLAQTAPVLQTPAFQSLLANVWPFHGLEWVATLI